MVASQLCTYIILLLNIIITEHIWLLLRESKNISKHHLWVDNGYAIAIVTVWYFV